MRPIDLERLNAIKQMLFSIALGNFDTRIARTEEDDIIESISVLVNMMAEEMRETLRLYSDLHTDNSIMQHNNMVFILDDAANILYLSGDVFSEFGYVSTDLIKKPFSNILSPGHFDLWGAIYNRIFVNQEFHEQQNLLFVLKNGMERCCSCVITSLYDPSSSNRYIMISIYEKRLMSKMLDDQFRKKLETQLFSINKTKGPPNILTSQKDRRTLGEIHQYLLQNLDKEFPSLKKLAHQFGTNDFKLKYGFKQLYGNSVFRFFKEERLKKGRQLLMDTELPVKSIAPMCGYSNSSHFSKDFRLRYGGAPKGFR